MPNNQDNSRPRPNSTGGIPVQPQKAQTGTIPQQPQQGASGTGALPRQPSSNTGQIPQQGKAGTGQIPQQGKAGTGQLPKQGKAGTGQIPVQQPSGTGTPSLQAPQDKAPRRGPRHMGLARPTAGQGGARSATKAGLAGHGMAIAVIGGIAVLGLGFALGRLTAPSMSVAAVGTPLVEEARLDDPIATYAGESGSGTITIREVMEANASTKAYETNGMYRVPSADLVIASVRSRIVAEAAKAEGVEVTDADLDAQAESQLGEGMGAKEFAAAYSVDEETGKRVLSSTVIMNKLREKVAGKRISVDVTPPDEPAHGAEEVPTAAYAKYVLGLVGDAWNADKGEWADPEGVFATQLGQYDLTQGEMTYEVALAAYSAAYQTESSKQAEAETTWNKYLNDLYDKVAIQIGEIGIG